MPRVFHASSDWFAAGHLLFRTGIVGSAGKAVKDFLHSIELSAHEIKVRPFEIKPALC